MEENIKYLDSWARGSNFGKLNFVEQLRLRSTPVEKTLISGLDAKNLALCTDWSHWQGDVNVNQLKIGGVSLGFVKASDGKQVISGDPSNPKTYKDDWLDRNIQKLFDNDLPCGVYHYVQPHFPEMTAKNVIEHNWEKMKYAMTGKVPGKSFHAYVLDVEEKTATANNGSDVVLGLIELIKKDSQLGAVPLIVYTSISVLNYYVKLREQLSFPGAEANLWMAQWAFNTVTTTTWENLWSQYIPKLEMKVLTPGYQTWMFLQWSSSFILPGCTGRMDLNFFKGTRNNLNNWLNYKTDIPVEPPPVVVVPVPPVVDNEFNSKVLESLTKIENSVIEIRSKFS